MTSSVHWGILQDNASLYSYDNAWWACGWGLYQLFGNDLPTISAKAPMSCGYLH